ncbi:MAG TPA: hypothetical protein VGN85_04665 [Methyloceanibacter sp.]|nr:hypothetical protein [Methyloceanibacter sp.]
MSMREQGATCLDRPPVPVALPLLALVAISFVTPAQAQQFNVPSSATSAIVDQTNAYRREKGLAPLSESAGAKWTRSLPAAPCIGGQVLQVPWRELA